MNKISKKTFEGDFYDFLEYLEEKSFEEHRRGSTFYVKYVIDINEEDFPEVDRKYDGLWETNQFVESEEDRDLNEIYELNRVEKIEKTIIVTEYQLVKDESSTKV